MLEFEVKGQKIKRTDRTEPATDSVNYLKAKFNFDDDWNGKTKTAYFKREDAVYSVLVGSDNSCTVPAEVLVRNESRYARSQGNTIYVTVVGTYNTTVITTNETSVTLNLSGYGEAEEPSEPTAELHQQLLTAYSDTQTKYDETQQSLKLYSNALKGNVSGTTVSADDVSPIEHELDVCVHGKNLFDISKISTMETSANYAYISEIGNDYLIVSTPNGYEGNGYCTIQAKLKDVCPSLKVGKTYILSANTESNSSNIYLPNIQKSWVFGETMVMTEKAINSNLTFYGLSANEGYGTGNCRISNIQVEVGDTTTSYEPYINTTNTIVTVGEETFMALSDGTVEGISSVELADGISTEAEGMTIDVEYNKDINNVIEKLTDAITALGGTI